jgi:lysophospholipase
MTMIFQSWTAPDGWVLRTAQFDASAPLSGSVVFLNGRADFIEKYATACDQIAGWGLRVVTLDWRGQGESGRLGDHPHKGHQIDFGQWVADARGWLRDIGPSLPKPWTVIGHSMGGHLAVRLMHDEPEWFEKAVLLAPLLGLVTRPLPKTVVRRLADWQVRKGRGLAFGPGQVPYGFAQQSQARFLRLTSDRAFFDAEHEQIAANPALALGGVTYGWLNACFRSLDLIAAPGFAEAIKTRCLILMPDGERLVMPAVARAFAARLPHGQYEVVRNARHELLRERADVRTAVMSRIHAFLESR